MGKGSRPHRSTKPRRTRRAGIGHSRAGRPRKAGERYENGRLRPAGPNERVLALRRRLLDRPEAAAQGLRAAENPLDLMLARGWIGQEAHSAGKAFARLHAEARMSLAPIRVSSLERPVRGAGTVRTDPVALWRLNRIWAALAGRPAAAGALVEVCVLEAWPAWLIGAASAQDAQVRAGLLAGRGRAALEAGLAACAAQLREPLPRDLGEAREMGAFVDWVRTI